MKRVCSKNRMISIEPCSAYSALVLYFLDAVTATADKSPDRRDRDTRRKSGRDTQAAASEFRMGVPMP